MSAEQMSPQEAMEDAIKVKQNVDSGYAESYQESSEIVDDEADTEKNGYHSFVAYFNRQSGESMVQGLSSRDYYQYKEGKINLDEQYFNTLVVFNSEEDAQKAIEAEKAVQ